MDLQQFVLVIGVGIGGLLALLFAGALYQVIGSINDARRYPPMGTLVDVGGYRLHISSSGEGSPTVIMDAGLGHVSLIWSLVQPGVAQFTCVCIYDRAGYAWSDPGPEPRTDQQIARELHTLLINAATEPKVPASMVFTAMIPMRRLPLADAPSVLPGLKPNQPKARMKQPSRASI